MDKNFTKVKAEAEAIYRVIREVHCPYLNEPIAFNRKGLQHIKFKKNNEIARNRADQYIRLKNIKFARRILEESTTLQEFKYKIDQDVKYYGFIAIVIDSGLMKRFKIVVKQVGDNKPYFWSIIPLWKSSKELLRVHSGDLEED